MNVLVITQLFILFEAGLWKQVKLSMSILNPMYFSQSTGQLRWSLSILSISPNQQVNWDDLWTILFPHSYLAQSHLSTHNISLCLTKQGKTSKVKINVCRNVPWKPISQDKPWNQRELKCTKTWEAVFLNMVYQPRHQHINK